MQINKIALPNKCFTVKKKKKKAKERETQKCPEIIKLEKSKLKRNKKQDVKMLFMYLKWLPVGLKLPLIWPVCIYWTGCWTRLQKACMYCRTSYHLQVQLTNPLHSMHSQNKPTPIDWDKLQNMKWQVLWEMWFHLKILHFVFVHTLCVELFKKHLKHVFCKL